jgi:PTS system galactitol-specific IIB component
MEAKKRILVTCGSATAISTDKKEEIKEALENHRVLFATSLCKVNEVYPMAHNADLIIPTTPIASEHGKPNFQTLAFNTGIGKEAVIDQIINTLND